MHKSRRIADCRHIQIRLAAITADFIRQATTGLDVVVAAYLGAIEELCARLPASWSDLDEVEYGYLFAATVAHNLKPYGPGTAPDLQAMLSAKTLDCSNYGLLTHYIATACLPTKQRIDLVFVGWDGGVIGNHQMLFVGGGRNAPRLLLDPTVGLCAHATFNQIASGQPLAPDDLIAINQKSELEESRTRIAAAFYNGAFRPSDLLYYFEGVDHLLERFGHPADWPTPGAVFWRAREAKIRGME